MTKARRMTACGCIFGPDIKKGAVLNNEVHHIDVFATIAYLMKVQTHDTKGVLLKDCFKK